MDKVLKKHIGLNLHNSDRTETAVRIMKITIINTQLITVIRLLRGSAKLSQVFIDDRKFSLVPIHTPDHQVARAVALPSKKAIMANTWQCKSKKVNS